ALERRRGLGVMPERELAARDPERQLGPDVEELVEGAVRLRGRRPLEPLEDREGLRGAAVAQQVPGVLEVDDVREVPAGVVATQALESVARGREAVVLEEAPLCASRAKFSGASGAPWAYRSSSCASVA